MKYLFAINVINHAKLAMNLIIQKVALRVKADYLLVMASVCHLALKDYKKYFYCDLNIFLLLIFAKSAKSYYDFLLYKTFY